MIGPHLKAIGTRSAMNTRAYPLNEPNMPSGFLPGIIDWLQVETRPRYAPVPDGSTFCNIYASDVAFLSGVYLPRVWWNHPEKVTPETQPKYGDTVYEVSADGLYDWLVKWGSEFGWRPVECAVKGQELADTGFVVVICAAQRDPTRAGHIVVISPQNESAGLVADQGSKFIPLQSQAGRHNYCASCSPGRWWENTSYRGFGIWSNKTAPAVQST